MHLYIGYKRYSSWSLRPWLLMKTTDIAFTETVLPFAHDDSLNQLATTHRVPATVPLLEHNGQMIWDSLAIMEYLAETFPEKQLWPADPMQRALARSASAEMHSGFVALRREHPMNCHRIVNMKPNSEVEADLNRLAIIWQHLSTASNSAGDFLCGDFGIIDAMFAPVAWRAKGYQLTITPAFDQWSEALMSLPAMDDWVREGAQETWRVEDTEQVGL